MDIDIVEFLACTVGPRFNVGMSTMLIVFVGTDSILSAGNINFNDTGMSVDQWIFLPAHLNQTPAILVDKESLHHELKRRNAGVEFLFRVGLQLKLYVQLLFNIQAFSFSTFRNVPVLATASIFFHRFYMRQSIDGHVIYVKSAQTLHHATRTDAVGEYLGCRGCLHISRM